MKRIYVIVTLVILVLIGLYLLEEKKWPTKVVNICFIGDVFYTNNEQGSNKDCDSPQRVYMGPYQKNWCAFLGGSLITNYYNGQTDSPAELFDSKTNQKTELKKYCVPKNVRFYYKG